VKNIDTRHDFLLYGVSALVVPTLIVGALFWVKRKDWF
jgi:magnesium transporter